MSNSFITFILAVALVALAPVASYAQWSIPVKFRRRWSSCPKPRPRRRPRAYPTPPIGQQSFSGFLPAISAHPLGARR
jgi:hypothetical protein